MTRPCYSAKLTLKAQLWPLFQLHMRPNASGTEFVLVGPKGHMGALSHTTGTFSGTVKGLVFRRDSTKPGGWYLPRNAQVCPFCQPHRCLDVSKTKFVFVGGSEQTGAVSQLTGTEAMRALSALPGLQVLRATKLRCLFLLLLKFSRQKCSRNGKRMRNTISSSLSQCGTFKAHAPSHDGSEGL